MPNTTIALTKTAELPTIAIEWLDDDGDIINFSGGWTFELKIGYRNETALLTKVAGITGAATSPNVIISWDIGELANLSNNIYIAQLRATSLLHDRIKEFNLAIQNPVL